MSEEKPSLVEQLYQIASNAREAGAVSEIRLIERQGIGSAQVETELIISYQPMAQ